LLQFGLGYGVTVCVCVGCVFMDVFDKINKAGEFVMQYSSQAAW